MKLLPQPSTSRWQPLRMGLINLFKYDQEEFVFEKGKLLLRGNNGTGKSRILALTLPFLLDGEVASHRVEPDRDPAKKIEWNLLMGGKHKERLGYVWIEFGRKDEKTSEEFFVTLGCGLEAVEGRGLSGKWFFVTEKRVGVDLSLISGSEYPLSKSQLQAEVISPGKIFSTAASYREEVDQRLFGLGTRRYEALMNLLIQLRQPKLSREFDEIGLSKALSEALPPPNTALVSDIADSFRGLEQERIDLEHLIAASEAVNHFLDQYRKYAKIASKREAERFRAAQSQYEDILQKLREIKRDRETAEQEVEATAEEYRILSQQRDELECQIATLRSSPEMRDAEAIDQLRSKTKTLLEIKDKTKRTVQAAQVIIEKRKQEKSKVDFLLSQTENELQTLLGQTTSLAHQIGIPDPCRELRMQEGLAQIDLQVHKKAAIEHILTRTDQIKHIEKLISVFNSAGERLKVTKQLLGREEAVYQSRLRSHNDAEIFLDSEIESYSNQFSKWTASLNVLKIFSEMEFQEPAFQTQVLKEIHTWLEDQAGRSKVFPLRSRMILVRSEKEAEFTTIGTHLRRDEEEKKRFLNELGQQKADLSSGKQAPPVPYTRSQKGRTGRKGAPFWKVCDFLPHLSESEKAGIESALEASGILDAWVNPNGIIEIQTQQDEDTFIRYSESDELPSEKSLASVLAPILDQEDPMMCELNVGTLSRLFQSIGFGADTGSVWINNNGQWQVGPLKGFWKKPVASYIGETAREAARKKKLEEIKAQEALIHSEIQTIQGELLRITECQKLLKEECNRFPNETRCTQAYLKLQYEIKGLEETRKAFEIAQRNTLLESEKVEKAEKGLRLAASELNLTEWVARTAELKERIQAYQITLSQVWSTLGSFLSIRERVNELLLSLQDDAIQLQGAVDEESLAQKNWVQAEVELRTLEETVGKAIAEIQCRLSEARQAFAEVVRQTEGVSQKKNEATARELSFGVQIQFLGSELETKTTLRDAIAATFKVYLGSGLVSVVGNDLLNFIPSEDILGISITRLAEIGRKIEEVCSSIEGSDDIWNRNQKAVYSHVEDLRSKLLILDYSPVLTQENNVLLVTVPFRGQDQSMDSLSNILASEINSRQQLLNAREREVLENHLVGEVASHLHDLIHSGERWVNEINQELAEKPMSTGMRLRFSWEELEEGSVEFVAARKLLLRSSGTWSIQERNAVGDFLQRQIIAARQNYEALTWQESLEIALDYRNWHRFKIEKYQEGVWKRLTKRTYGTGSGGEKAIALAMPQFAAAAAHYRSAGPHAPRLILLDEAFVGVDNDMRAKCLDLLNTFDLDLVMTSEREWACYPTVSGIAIYQLSTESGVDAVWSTRWIWNGIVRTESVE